MIVGLTGGIGSGKSSAAKFFIELGIDVIDADEVSKNILDSNIEARIKNLDTWLKSLDDVLYYTAYDVEGNSSFTLPLILNNKDKVTSKKLEHQNEVYPLKEIIENEIDDQKNSLINLSENTEKSESKSDQISLLDLDENEKAENIDDVLEIPAFLRRQAN